MAISWFKCPGAVSQPVTTASLPHAGTAGGQGTSPAVAGQLSQHSHCQLGPFMDHPQTFQFSLLQAEDSLEDNISLDNNVYDFCLNLCYDSVLANQDVGFSDELIRESVQSELDRSSDTKGNVEDKLDSDLGPGPELTNVKGRLAERLAFWQNMGASDFILEVIGKGSTLPFVKEPEPAVFGNNQSAKNYPDFVTSEILRLLKEVTRGEVHTINPLSVADNGKKLRLILDLRYINKHLWVQKFKYEDFRTFQNLFSKGDFFFETDLKSGYHYLDILEGHQKYLGFSWCINGMQRYFVFTVLVFGLATASFIFTKVVKVLIKQWRSMAIRIFAFVDDILGGGRSKEEASRISCQVKKDLELSGFVACPEKSHWEPTQKGEHLGFFIDLETGTFSVPVRCTLRLQEMLDIALNSKYTTARKLASISGTLISMGLALGPVARLWTRPIYHQINSRQSWDREMILTSESRHELDFWNMCFYEYNGQPIWPIAPKCTITSYSDASAQGWGGYIVQIGASISRGNFSENEAGKSSTWRELKGTLNVLSSSVEIIHSQIVKHHADN